MAIEIIASFSVNPLEIEYILQLADFKYPITSEAEQFSGWTKFPVISSLYNWTVQNSRPPRSDEGVSYLLTKCDDGVDMDSPKIKKRAQKLWMDFCREIHTLGLLQRNESLGFVSYQKALDIHYNVDYVVRLLYETIDNGVQSAMRLNWNEEIWSKIKQQRRNRRGNEILWPGRIFWLTNKDLRVKKEPNKCWLFDSRHISSLISEIKRGSEFIKHENAAIQLKLV